MDRSWREIVLSVSSLLGLLGLSVTLSPYTLTLPGILNAYACMKKEYLQIYQKLEEYTIGYPLPLISKSRALSSRSLIALSRSALTHRLSSCRAPPSCCVVPAPVSLPYLSKPLATARTSAFSVLKKVSINGRQ